MDEIILVHDEELATSGGQPGIRDRARIESAVLRPQQGYGDRDFYPDLPAKAAVIFEELCCGHGFIDGNKRTAVVIVDTFGVDRSLKEGEIQLAEELLETLEERRPEHKDVRERREKFTEYQAKSQKETAKELLSEADERSVDNEWGEAVDWLSSALTILDRIDEAHRGDDYQNLFQEVERALHQAIPQYKRAEARAHYESGNTYRGDGRWLKADEEYKAALETLDLLDDAQIERAHRQLRQEIDTARSQIASNVDEARAAEQLREAQENADSTDAIAAWVTCQRAVKNQLQSPSSAKFAPIHQVYGGPTGGGRWVVGGWVDAENAFGAVIRNDAVCELREVGELNFKVIQAGID